MTIWMIFALMCYLLYAQAVIPAKIAIALVLAPPVAWGLFIFGLLVLTVIAAICDSK